MFSHYLECWGLTPDGDPIVTRTSRLLPVRQNGLPAMLKLAVHPTRRQGFTPYMARLWNRQAP
jgi:streptomycin 6-kinase